MATERVPEPLIKRRGGGVCCKNVVEHNDFDTHNFSIIHPDFLKA